MRASKLNLITLREDPADAEVISHRLMLRSGILRAHAAGIYSWMTLGIRVQRKIEAIVREEMNHINAAEIVMPAIQPAGLWRESGRWEEYGPELLRLHDRHGREFCVGPTHEEILTDIARRDISSYRQLPLTFYQIQTKFRDEVRPRFGAMRAREFVMKDAYSLHLDEASLAETFWDMHRAYTRIFERLGLQFRSVDADTGSIGGSESIEFHVVADSGEDALAISEGGEFAANVEKTAVLARPERASPEKALEQIHTPGITTIAGLCELLPCPPEKTLKTLIVRGSKGGAVSLVIRGDHQLNAIKAEALDEVAQPLEMLEKDEVAEILGCPPGSLGPGLDDIPLVADHAAAATNDFHCGANREWYHLLNANWGRDFPEPKTADLRNAVTGDASPTGDGSLRIVRGIEVGHIFQLGLKYSQAMQARVSTEDGDTQPLYMGCYGIGITRLVAAAIEQNHDRAGIRWPLSIAPFQVALAPVRPEEEAVRKATEELYEKLTEAGIETLLDDRGLRPGPMFADLDLIGIPYRLVISPLSLERGGCEFSRRGGERSESRVLPFDEAIKALTADG